MDFQEYQEKALRTAGPECRGNLAYSMGGVGGEAGEYVDVVKKHLWHGVSEEDSRDKALKELGDLLWGVAQAADAWGLSLEEVAGYNLAKLAARYPNGFTTEASKARVDTQPEVTRWADPAVAYERVFNEPMPLVTRDACAGEDGGCPISTPCVMHVCRPSVCFCPGAVG